MPGTVEANRHPAGPMQPGGYPASQPGVPAYPPQKSTPTTERTSVGLQLTQAFGHIQKRLKRRFSSRAPQQARAQPILHFGQEAPISTPAAPGLAGPGLPEHQVGGNLRLSGPEASFPEPAGLALERAIILSMNRTPAESRIDLPIVRVDRSESHPQGLKEVIEPALAQPRQAPNLVRSGPVIVQPRQPDGKGAPLPRNQKQFRRRLIGSGVAAFLALVVISVTAWWLLTPPKDPTLVVPTQLGSFPAQSLAAASLFLQPGWSAADSSQVATAADHISARALPPQPDAAAAIIAKGTPSALASRIHTLDGLGQAQMTIAGPMDVSIAANDQYIVEAVDGGLQLIDTKGKVLTLGFVQFFRPVRHGDDVFGEPRVIFDPTGQQWVLVVNEVKQNSLGIAASYFDVAVSLTNSPFERWRIYQINTQTDDYGECNWADDPQLGSNTQGFFISGSSFDCGTDGALKGVVLWELPRATYGAGTKGTPPTLRWTRFTNKGQPLLSLVPAVEAGTTSTEWLVGNDAGQSGAADYGNASQNLYLWAIGQKSSASQALPGALVTLPSAYADPPQAHQPTPNQQAGQPSSRLSTGDARVASAQFINNHLYLAFTTAINWEGDTSTRSGIYWIELTASLSARTNIVSTRIVQAGIVGLPRNYLFTPMLVADAEGNLFLAAQIASFGRNPGIIYTSRRSADPAGQMGGQGNMLVALQTGAVPFGGRWGDYAGGSLVVLDSKRASSKLWIAAPVVDPGNQSDQASLNWHTRMWEFDTGGSDVQNIL
jgi:hypothetical protein